MNTNTITRQNTILRRLTIYQITVQNGLPTFVDCDLFDEYIIEGYVDDLQQRIAEKFFSETNSFVCQYQQLDTYDTMTIDTFYDDNSGYNLPRITINYPEDKLVFLPIVSPYL